jgi:hypothetical protein
MLADGSHKSIAEVVVGDSIFSSDRAGKTSFSKVIAVPHGPNTQSALFIQLATASADIKMTAAHLVMVDRACSGATALMEAASVEVGMCLLSTTGPQAVESVLTVEGHGIYSVVTEEEFIVVNGFVASPFAVNHAVPNAYYNVVRTVPALLNTELAKQANLLFGALAASVIA